MILARSGESTAFDAVAIEPNTFGDSPPSLRNRARCRQHNSLAQMLGNVAISRAGRAPGRETGAGP